MLCDLKAVRNGDIGNASRGFFCPHNVLRSTVLNVNVGEAILDRALFRKQGNGGTPKAGTTAQATWPFPQFASTNSFGAAPSFLPQQAAGAPGQQQV